MHYVILQDVWPQVSADYDAVKRTRTLVVTPETTVADVMKWAENCNVLGKGDIRITVSDTK